MSDRIEVRRARREDAPVLLDLIRGLAEYEKLAPPDEAAQARLVRDMFCDCPRLDAFLVYVDQRPAGYALVLETYSSFLALPTLYLEDIFVLPEFRGRKAGSALFRAVATEACDRGCGRMEWVVLDWNTTAQEFYKRYGAKPLSDWITMRLTGDEIAKIVAE